MAPGPKPARRPSTATMASTVEKKRSEPPPRKQSSAKPERRTVSPPRRATAMPPKATASPPRPPEISERLSERPPKQRKEKRATESPPRSLRPPPSGPEKVPTGPRRQSLSPKKMERASLTPPRASKHGKPSIPPQEEPAPSKRFSRAPKQPTTRPQARPKEPAQQSPPARGAAPPAKGAPVSQEIDLDEAHQREVSELFDRLGRIDHYALLGVPRTADKKEIKRAYFERTARFHPDRFFRKRLGPFKAKMETLFAKMTEAYEVLTRDARRAEYDASLGSAVETLGLEELIARANEEQAREDEARRKREAMAASPTIREVPESRALRISIPLADDDDEPASPKPSRAISPPSMGDSGPADPRDLFARRLTGGGPAPSIKMKADAQTLTASGTYAKDDAVDALRQRYATTVASARSAQIKKYVDLAKASLERKDYVAASNAYRLAVGFDPNDPTLKREFEEAQCQADKVLAGQYLAHAQHEEKEERWGDAANSWQRVARVKSDDPRALERAAHCIMKARGNLHVAAELAKRAAELAPKDPQVHVTMANVLLAAGLTKNARRELETAVSLAPNDVTLRSLLKRVAEPA